MRTACDRRSCDCAMEQRQVIILRFVEELDYREVAQVIGKSVPAVRVIQHRGAGQPSKNHAGLNLKICNVLSILGVNLIEE